ncbi:Asparaginase/glutaminase [Aspergillus egyptiacus]|nr:Asparaginase/glutaminase [Aspergillus egyptiacus]
MRFTSVTLAALSLGVSTAASGLEWISRNETLPKVLLCSAGGTILSASNYSRLDNIHYGAGDGPSPYDMIETVPEVLDVAQIAVIEFPVSGGSSGLNSSLYLNITQHLNKLLCSADSDIAGAIMFHGTNTLEETAFGVDLTFNCSKPYVATGAMRPDSYISPDGRSNFFQAVTAAVSPASRDRGGLIAFNDRITSIYYSTKAHGNAPDTFLSMEQGKLGAFLGGHPYYFFGPALPTGRPHFDVSCTEELPSVVVLYGHQGFDASLMYAAVANGAKGLVVMAPGAASLSPDARDAAEELYAKGIPTVAVQRMIMGTGAPDLYPESVIYAAYLGGPQARIMLQLAINAGYSLDEIRSMFEGPMREAYYTSPASKEYYGLA